MIVSGPRPISAEVARFIAMILPRLASGFDGEIVATARAIDWRLKAAGFDFHNIAVTGAGEPIKSVMVAECLKNCDLFTVKEDVIGECLGRTALFTEREARFVSGVSKSLAAGHDLSAKQLAWLTELQKIAVTGWDRSE